MLAAHPQRGIGLPLVSMVQRALPSVRLDMPHDLHSAMGGDLPCRAPPNVVSSHSSAPSNGSRNPSAQAIQAHTSR